MTSAKLPGAAEAAARARATPVPEWAPIPEPIAEGKRQLRCAECNRRFLSVDRYRLHWRTQHDPTQTGGSTR